jgi:hypothetical protein
MARKDKLLDILAMAQLPEDAKIARMAHRWIGKAFPRAQARAIVECYFNANGRTPKLVQALVDEKNRQEKLRNSRAAFATAAEERAKSPMLRFKGAGGEKARKQRAMEIAQKTFGQHVRDNFNDNTLALMSLISGEDRWYKIKWIDAGFKPLRSATIEVIAVTKGGPIYTRFLLYRTNGRVLAARTTGRNMDEAWGGQLPSTFMAKVGEYQAEGCTFQMDYESQEMVITGPEGLVDRVAWTGQTVND